jgi:hypothetical protein
MFVRFNRGSMIAILPKCAFALLSQIIFLCSPSRDELQAFGDDVLVCVFHQ